VLVSSHIDKFMSCFRVSTQKANRIVVLVSLLPAGLVSQADRIF